MNELKAPSDRDMERFVMTGRSADERIRQAWLAYTRSCCTRGADFRRNRGGGHNTGTRHPESLKALKNLADVCAACGDEEAAAAVCRVYCHSTRHTRESCPCRHGTKPVVPPTGGGETIRRFVTEARF